MPNQEESSDEIESSETDAPTQLQVDSPRRRLIGFGILYLIVWPLAVVLIFFLFSLFFG